MNWGKGKNNINEYCWTDLQLTIYSKTCVKRQLRNRQDKDLNDKWELYEGQKYCRMLQGEHSTILLTCIKQLLVLKTNFGSF